MISSAIVASLQEKQELRVQRLAGPHSEILARLEPSPPDVILFDLAGANSAPDWIFQVSFLFG